MYANFVFSAAFFFGTVFLWVNAEPIDDKQALLAFVQNISHSRPLNWDLSASACANWTGVTCNHDSSRIISLRLPGMTFRGPIPSNTLSRLSALQILSLRSNQLSGPFPSDFSNLKNLTALFLRSNNFSGSLPLNFSVWSNLAILDLSNNYFDGSIPPSLLNLTHLTALSLAGNSLSGEIPNVNVSSLQLLDLSNNKLTGFVPKSLQRFPSSAFLGNNLYLVDSSSPVLPPTPQPLRKSSKLSEPAVLGIVIGACSLGFFVIALLMVVCYSKENGKNVSASKKPQKSESKEKSVNKSASGSQDGSLVFFEGSNLVFDLEDLLRASAEVLGKGTFGTNYKAALEDGNVVVVKRLKEVVVAKRDFEQQMEAIGGIKHDNVAPLRAYYYSKDEKLVVHDYYTQGSVSSMLHGKRGVNQTHLDWESRLRIAIGAARGIAHVHSQSSRTLVHGNIKSSNVFLNSKHYGCVSDVGLSMLMGPLPDRAGGYRAPEVVDSRKAQKPSDVFSYGVLLLELLTGKSPAHAAGGDGASAFHLVRWVHSVVREEWTAEVFDVELLKYHDVEEEMVELLQVGLQCVAKMPEQRPKMADVVKMVEDVRRGSMGITSEASTPTITPAIMPQLAEIASSSLAQ